MSGSHIIRELRWALLLCLFAVLAPRSLLALDPNRTLGQYILTRWSSDSFPGGAINAIAQTPDGYLWIGTANGLVRFDGISFRLIDHTSSPSFPASPVLGLVVDAEGALWVRMQSPYLTRYRRGAFEQMYPAKIPPEFTYAREEGAAALARGTRGEVVIATSQEPLRYAAGKFTPFVASGKVHGIPTSLAETADGATWIGTRDSGLFCVREGRGVQVPLPDHKVNVLLPDGGSKLWIGTDSGLARWDGARVTRAGVPAGLTRSPILAVARDWNSNLWVSTSSGIARVDSVGSVVHAPRGISAGAVHAIFEDREGNVWLGGTEGLTQLRDSPFLRYTGVAGEGSSLYADDSGRTWIAPSSGGLVWIRGPERHVVTAGGVDRDVIYSISGAQDELWLARKFGGVTQLRVEAGRLEARTYTARDGLASGVVHAIHRSRDGSVWAGTLSGAVSRIGKGRVTTFTVTSGLTGDAVTTIEEGPDGILWVGTAGGLVAFRDGHWRRYGGEAGLPPARVNSLTFDREGVLWVASSSGLFYWSGSHFETVPNVPDSLLGEIYGLVSDDTGSLWATTDRNVMSISRGSLLGQSKEPAAVRRFGAADGLPSTRGIRRDHSVAKDPSGRIWFSLQGGIAVANPSLPSSVAPPLVRVESVAVDGRSLVMEPVAHYRSDGRRVVFNFAGVSLAVPGRVRYRYLLDGYDTDWSQPTESREAAYTNLPPARYVFRVMASNSEGLWNGHPAALPLEVEPQLSQTWWFRLTGVCLAAVSIYAGFRYRMSRVHAAMNLRFEERLAERTRIARELHDTLLQSFQGLMLRLQVVEDLLPPGRAKEQLEQSLERADQAIAEGRSVVYDLRSSTATNDLAEAVRALGDELAAQHSTVFHLVVEGSARELQPVIRDELYRITREALRNASRHAAARHIETEITYGERALRLRIRDDGRGIPPEVLEAGRPGHYGLSGMRERAEQIGAKLEIWSGAKTGTEIALSIAGPVAYRTPAGKRLLGLFPKKAG